MLTMFFLAYADSECPDYNAQSCRLNWPFVVRFPLAESVDTKTSEVIRIFQECEVQTENFLSRITVRLHEDSLSCIPSRIMQLSILIRTD